MARIGGAVRPLTPGLFVFDFGGYLGELVFELAESGAATRVTVREMAFAISLTAEREPDGASCSAPPAPTSEVSMAVDPLYR